MNKHNVKLLSDAPKVAILVTRFPSLSQTFIALQIADLVKSGFHVEIFNFGDIGNPAWLPEGAEQLLSSLKVHNYLKKTDNIETLNQTKKSSQFEKTISALRFFRIFSNEKYNENLSLYRFLKPLTSTDIIHYQCIDLAKKVSRLRKYGFDLDKQKHVCSVRGSDISITKNTKKLNWKKLDRDLDALAPVCISFKDKLIKQGSKSRIEVIHSPINTEKLRNATVSKKPLNSSIQLVSVGRLVEKKGLSDAITMCAFLKEREINFHYSIVGEGPLQQALKEQVQSLKLDNHITFNGALPSMEALRQMSNSDILLAPSCRASDGDSEGIPNVIKEAMALGLQVIGTNHSGIPELITHQANGYICNEKDPQSLLETTLYVISNRKNWPIVAESAKKHVLQHYTPASTTEALHRLYISLMNNNAVS